jgi:hypothetical protein
VCLIIYLVNENKTIGWGALRRNISRWLKVVNFSVLGHRF